MKLVESNFIYVLILEETCSELSHDSTSATIKEQLQCHNRDKHQDHQQWFITIDNTIVSLEI